MPANQQTILLRVEKAREKLHQTQNKYGLLTHPKVIEQSMRLDKLLNQYHSNKIAVS
ncbi:aspartyl-phosphate phosphatase Spo0E family protein [Paenibacillus sp. sgz500958]|uniref:aspartyl-phosphate phosphatase Spo0E family protein n=1 Tax=Paenibacillus sp. sgz500958 TaxID=3242475 RepID=UPI0036D27D0F